MNIKTITISSTLLFCLMGLAGKSYGSDAITAFDIANKYLDQRREAHKSYIAKFYLRTCKYRVVQSQMKCSEKPRSSIVENIAKTFDLDTRSLNFILEPARDKGIGMFFEEYWETEKPNSTWIYLPALGKVKRIISSKESADSGSFFGSEFAVEDLEERKPLEYEFKILGEDKVKVVFAGVVEERDAWIIEWTPNSKRKERTQYSRSVTWIDKERYVRLKEEYYKFDNSEKVIKTLNLKDFIQQNGHWVSKNLTMNNLATKRVSTIDKIALVLDQKVDDEFLTRRTLTDFAFKERYLKKYRTYF